MSGRTLNIFSLGGVLRNSSTDLVYKVNTSHKCQCFHEISRINHALIKQSHELYFKIRNVYKPRNSLASNTGGLSFSSSTVT